MTPERRDGEGAISGMTIDETCNIAVLHLTDATGKEVSLFCETVPTLDALHAAFGGVVERAPGHTKQGDIPEVRYCLARAIGRRIAYRLTQVGSLDMFAVLPDEDPNIIMLGESTKKDPW